jgi:DNA-3-methyladenine glycosylase I
MAAGLPRCGWCGDDPLYVAYHDTEWGVPVADDRTLFEFLVLEGAQAGLSWSTILKKREGYRRAFDGFEPERVARYGPRNVASMLADPSIVRNRLKVESAVTNARAFLAVQDEWGSFARYIWDFVDGCPIQNTWQTMAELPATTPRAEGISRDLKRRGFRFVGPTIVYAHMQATGMVNDHLAGCFRHPEVAELGRRFSL